MDIFHDLLGAIEDREIPESEEVHLEESECLEWSSRELRHDRSRILRWWLEWTEVRHRLWCDDDSTCMDSELPYSPFHLHGSIDDFSIFLITFIC